MLSDESSSDSETGRFKCRTKKEDEQKSSKKEDNYRSLGRSRPSDDRYRRDFEKSRGERVHHDRYPRDRYRYGRPSPPRRRHSRDRSPNRRSRERERTKPRVESPPKPRAKDRRSSSKDRRRHSRSRSHRSPEPKRDLKEELKRHLKEEIKPKEKTPEKTEIKSSDKSSSPDYKGKRSVVHKPTESLQKRHNHSPIIVKDDSDSEEVQAGSYYSMVPAVVIKDKAEEVLKAAPEKEKSEESSEIDSSDDERLRAKLLNLEKELHKSRKKKHKKKHKKKKSSKDNDHDGNEPTAVEVTSTTDIEKAAVSNDQAESAEVTSTQKSNLKESSEEGEITSGDDSQEHYEIEPTDLRHKLKRKVKTTEGSVTPKEICGPALPPHLQSKHKRSVSPNTEGPALPSHLKSKSRNIGPSIPENMRQILAERKPDDVKYVSSEEDDGVGPLPADAEKKWSDAHKRLEERALDIKIKKMEGHSMRSSDVKSREQWMLELPEGKAKYLGLEARSFRAREAPDMSDRSSWTDTPEEKARKAAGVVKEDPEAALQREARARHIATRDDEQEKAVKKHKKKHKRDESLLELHQKKLKKKKKKEEKDEKQERRPFSRDVDLQVNRFDEAQKKSIIKKAQDLNTRFSRGEAKYL